MQVEYGAVNWAGKREMIWLGLWRGLERFCCQIGLINWGLFFLLSVFAAQVLVQLLRMWCCSLQQRLYLLLISAYDQLRNCLRWVLVEPRVNSQEWGDDFRCDNPWFSPISLKFAISLIFLDFSLIFLDFSLIFPWFFPDFPRFFPEVPDFSEFPRISEYSFFFFWFPHTRSQMLFLLLQVSREGYEERLPRGGATGRGVLL